MTHRDDAISPDSACVKSASALAEPVEPVAATDPSREPAPGPAAPSAPAAPAQSGSEGVPEPARERPSSSAAVKERPAPPKVDQLPPYRVLLHNDDHNDMMHVVRTLVELTPLNKTRAVEVTLEAHTRGVALVVVTHKERAELYQQQFASKSLTATIEPVT